MAGEAAKRAPVRAVAAARLRMDVSMAIFLKMDCRFVPPADPSGASFFRTHLCGFDCVVAGFCCTAQGILRPVCEFCTTMLCLRTTPAGPDATAAAAPASQFWPWCGELLWGAGDRGDTQIPVWPGGGPAAAAN